MELEEPIRVNTTTIDYDGGHLGHSKVYLKFGPEGELICPYCSRCYVQDEGAPQAAVS
ncbi:MAG TPA: zinc-finger domain-containing protein [Rhodospirillales bacterium]|jgi:uncharacterized Zn-finger protein|nr:zinc-finger domain-containing protein [Rhodospirillales bacterium]